MKLLIKFVFILFLSGLSLHFTQPVTAQTPPALRPLSLGGQPLALPTGLTTVVMHRDLLLRERLAGLGVSLSFQYFLDGKSLAQAMAEGRLQAGVLGDMPTVLAVAKGLVVATALSKMSYASVVSRTSEPLSALKGKKVAMVEGSSGHQTLLQGMKENGLAPTDLILVPMSLADMPHALDRGEVEAFAAWEPTPSQALRENPHFVVIYRGLTFSYFTLARSLIQERPDVAREILAGHLRAIRWMMTPENLLTACQWNQEAALILSPDFHIPPLEQCAAIARRDLLEPAPGAQIPREILSEEGLIAEQIAFLISQGKLQGKTEIATILKGYDPAWNREILQEPHLHALDTYSYSQTPLQTGK